MSDHIKTYLTKDPSPSGDPSKEVTGTDISGNKRALDVNVAGGSLPITLQSPKSRTIQTLNVTDVATLITAIADRVDLSIRNLSEIDSIYLHERSDVEANDNVGLKAGWAIGAGESFNEVLDQTSSVYLIAETGKTVRAQVMQKAST
jgi:hypothetical protein